MLSAVQAWAELEEIQKLAASRERIRRNLIDCLLNLNIRIKKQELRIKKQGEKLE